MSSPKQKDRLAAVSSNLLALLDVQTLSDFIQSALPEHKACPLVAGFEIHLRPEDRGHNALIVDDGGWTFGADLASHRRSKVVRTLIRGVQMRIGDVHAHVEVPGDVPLGARADLPEREVRSAAVGRAIPNSNRWKYRAFNRHTARKASEGRRRQMLVDKVRCVLVVPHARVATIQAGSPARVPEMLIARIDTPGVGQFNWSSASSSDKGDVVVVDPILRPADADVVAVADRPAAGLGGVADRAFRVDEVRADRVPPPNQGR